MSNFVQLYTIFYFLWNLIKFNIVFPLWHSHETLQHPRSTYHVSLINKKNIIHTLFTGNSPKIKYLIFFVHRFFLYRIWMFFMPEYYACEIKMSLFYPQYWTYWASRQIVFNWVCVCLCVITLTNVCFYALRVV
jgi:hypothetical protein